MKLLQAIATMEGFYKMGSRPHRNNNPGDLRFCSESERFGATHGDPEFAVFPDESTGWAALKGWLSVPAHFDTQSNLIAGYMGASLSQILARFAPATENDCNAYRNFVCTQAGISPETIITEDDLSIPELPISDTTNSNGE